MENKMIDEKFTLFWHGPFSQWTKTEFRTDGVLYNTAEQYMMAQKALLFNDTEALNKIMHSDDPKSQKAFGRKVKNFNAAKWNQYAESIVYDANMAKFTQSPELLDILFETEGTTLVEASPYDKIWGIGMGKNDPRALNRDTWLGTNWLGEILTEVRNEIANTPYIEIWKIRNNYTPTPLF